MTKTIDSVIEQINFNKLVDISKFLTNLATDFNENKLPEWDGVLTKLTDQLNIIDGNATDFKKTVADSEYCKDSPDLAICKTIANIPSLDISLISDLNLEQYKLSEAVLQAIKDVNKVLENADQMINNFSSDFITDNIQSIKDTIEDLKKDINTQVDDIIKQVNNFNVEDAYENNFESIDYQLKPNDPIERLFNLRKSWENVCKAFKTIPESVWKKGFHVIKTWQDNKTLEDPQFQWEWTNDQNMKWKDSAVMGAYNLNVKKAALSGSDKGMLSWAQRSNAVWDSFRHLVNEINK